MELLKEFKWVVKETKIEHLLNNGKLVEKNVVTIGIKNDINNLIIPHPITHFIRQKYQFKGKSISSQLNPAREIVKFLNYTYYQININDSEFKNLVEKGFKGLKLNHASRYITYCSEKKLSYNYVKMSIERYLIHFYDYLNKMGLLEEAIEFETYINRKGDEVIISPFDHPRYNTQYPSIDKAVRNKLKDFGDNPEKRNQLVYEFIEEAKRISPDIAFGIGLQIFAGLRRGEVVNQTLATIPSNFLNGENYIAVLDNQHRLFENLKNTVKEQVKRPRLQPVLPSNYLKELFENHMKMNKQIKKNNIYALFCDHLGRTISGGSYERKFDKIKQSYINRLAHTEGRYLDFKMLDDAIWGTHIGRGIFTNYLYDMGLDDRQMSIARGDKNTQSSKDYIDYRNAINNFQESIEKINVRETLEDKWNFKNFTDKSNNNIIKVF